MLNWTLPSVLAIAVSWTALTSSSTIAEGQERVPGEALAVQAESTASATGRLTLPAKAPDWFLGGEVSIDDAIVQFQLHGKNLRYPYPADYSAMTAEERRAWFTAFKKTKAYEDHQLKLKKSYENRLIIEVPVDVDGVFLASGLEPGRYDVLPLIPHAKSTKRLRQQQAWAGNRGTQIVIKTRDQKTDLGTLALEYSNVVMPGDIAPQWKAQDFEGNPVQLSDFRGKYVLLDFWATWCIPCIEEIPNLKEIYRFHGGDRFEIIALSLDKSIDLPIDFNKTRRSPYTQLYAGSWFETETVTRDFGIKSVPSIWLIGPDGKVIARDLRDEALKDAVKKAVNLPPTTD